MRVCRCEGVRVCRCEDGVCEGVVASRTESPLVIEHHVARVAGKVTVNDNRLWRSLLLVYMKSNKWPFRTEVGSPTTIFEQARPEVLEKQFREDEILGRMLPIPDSEFAQSTRATLDS